MEIFVSWSGSRSHAVAIALRNWLPKMVNDLEPWLSSADIGKGARWGVDVAARLSTAKAGIICLTPDNLHSDWILFEAGALSKTIENTNVCTFLLGLEPSDLEPPLSQFQATKADQADVLKLLQTLNRALGESALPPEYVADAFEMGWPRLKLDLEKIPANEERRPIRSERQLLEEILDLIRGQKRPNAPFADDESASTDLRTKTALDLIVKSGAAKAVVLRRPDRGNVSFDVTMRDGRHRTVLLPKHVPFEKIEPYVTAQVPSDDTPPASVDANTAGP